MLPAHNPKDTKRWRTPSGNEIALTTEGEGAAAKDVISLHARNHVVLEAQVSHGGEEVFLMCGQSYVHLRNTNGQAHVEVTSAGSLLVHAAGHLQLEGDSVQILAKGGKVGVKDTVRGGSGFAGHKVLKNNSGQGKRTSSNVRRVVPQATTATRSGESATAGKQPGKGGKRYVVYRDANGNVREVNVDGSPAWRNNNPGNAEYDSITHKYGAIGRNPQHDFAIFPDHQSGMNAIVGKLQESRQYRFHKDGTPMTIHDAIYLWAPPKDHNDSAAYVRSIRDQTGLDPSQDVKNLSGSQLRSMANAIRVQEGTIPGTTYTPNSPNVPTWVKELMGH